jgi:hypothetical protein
VLGCGLVLNPENELSVFFTQNGILMGQGQSLLWLLNLMVIFTGKPIPIKSTVDTFYPIFRLRQILETTRPDLSAITSRNALNWTWNKFWKVFSINWCFELYWFCWSLHFMILSFL